MARWIRNVIEGYCEAVRRARAWLHGIHFKGVRQAARLGKSGFYNRYNRCKHLLHRRIWLFLLFTPRDFQSIDSNFSTTQNEPNSTIRPSWRTLRIVDSANVRLPRLSGVRICAKFRRPEQTPSLNEKSRNKVNDAGHKGYDEVTRP
jgi:hypothetical protein